MTSMRMRQVVLRILSRLLRWLPTPMVDSLRGLRYLTALRRTSPSAEPELAVVSVLVRPGDSCVDVGANFGFYTKEMSQLVGHGGWVYSVEPIPSTHSLLVANLKRLGLDNVRTFAVAATDHDGDLQMSIPMWGYGAPNYYEAHVVTPDTAAGAVQVKGCRLDTLLADPPGVVRLVKVDVEGHELEVLKGALHVIRDHKPAWLIEVSGDPDAAGSPAAAVVHLMRNEGYGIYRFDGRLVVPRRAGDQSTNYFFLLPAHVQRLRDARLA